LLVQLKTRQFRNLEPVDWRPGGGRHLLLGVNGAGKTSLLEAAYALATTKSFRTHRLAECVCHGTETFRLEGEIETDRRSRLEVSWSLEGGLDRRLNGGVAPLAEHLAVLPVVAWTHGETEVIAGAPRLRRRLLDRGVVGLRPVVIDALSRYRQAMEQKRELLARGTGREPLEPWNQVIAEAAATILRARQRYVERLSLALLEVLEVSGLALPRVELRYRPSPEEGLEGSEALALCLERMKRRERAAKLPLVGPHRDDLEVSWGGRAVRSVASAGELKALSLLLVAAQGRVMSDAGRPALHLLDDADAELARQTLERVWKVFSAAPQLFASSNRPDVWDGLEAESRWRVETGRLRLS